MDEALAGHCTKIEVVATDNSVSVSDNGFSIPVDIHKTEKKPAVEVVLTMLHAGVGLIIAAYKVSMGRTGWGGAWSTPFRVAGGRGKHRMARSIIKDLKKAKPFPSSRLSARLNIPAPRLPLKPTRKYLRPLIILTISYPAA